MGYLVLIPILALSGKPICLTTYFPIPSLPLPGRGGMASRGTARNH
jgi:hypothetical protein